MKQHKSPPPTPPPIYPVQGYTWRLNHGNWLVSAIPKDAELHCHYSQFDLSDDHYYEFLQRWLQLARFWWYVIGQPMVHHYDYDAVVDAAERLHHDDPEAHPLPIYWYWNHLPDRYDDWCRRLFSVVPQEARRPRYPWIYGEPGIYNCPLDFCVQSATMQLTKESQKFSSGKFSLPKTSFQFD